MHIVPFEDGYLASAAALLAARQRAERAREPALPPRLEDPAVAAEFVRQALGAPFAKGVAALHAGRLIGYLLGTLELPEPTSIRAMHDPPRAGWITNHAVEPAAAVETYRELYAALAPHWLARGCFVHHVGVRPGDEAARAAWFSLGFGQFAAHGLRDTTPLPTAPLPSGLTLRRAGEADLDAVVDVVDGVYRHLSASPAFNPYFPETLPDLRRQTATSFADPRQAAWLAERDGRVVGGVTLGPAPAALDAPERAAFLFDAYTAPGERGRGVGRALLDRALAWARAEDYAWLMLNYLSANLAAARFWPAQGFRPLTLFLQRLVDARIVWANGREQAAER